MPGFIQAMTDKVAIGWASHPFRKDYPVLVHAVLRTDVVHSVIADQSESFVQSDHADERHWFTIDLSALALSSDSLSQLSFMVGETDETLPRPGRAARRGAEPGGCMRLEDILAMNARRSWVTGATWHDAAQIGVSPEDILDLLYRDILGRPADVPGLTQYLRRLAINDTTYDGIRKSLINSGEYAARRIKAARAPGAIFSQRIALCSANRYVGVALRRMPERRLVDPAPLLALDAPAFLHAVYRDVLRRPAPGRLAMQVHLDRLAAGLSRQAFLMEILAETQPPGSDEIEFLDNWPDEDIDPIEAPGTVEIPASSPLLRAGWHPMETGAEHQRRWMMESGTIRNPYSAWPVESILIRVRNVYGAAGPMLRCFADETELAVSWEGDQGRFRIRARPIDGMPSPRFRLLRLDSLASGCPAQEGKGTDTRLISLLLDSVSFAYAPTQES